VDEPERPHLDTIVSPSSTLAIRGTRVSLYDQPPYAPEAVSLTGAAVFTDLHKQLIAFGAKGEGKATVQQGDTSAAENQLQAVTVDPRGQFAGRTEQDNQLMQALSVYGGTDFKNLGVFQFLVGQGGAASQAAIVGSLPDEGQLFFDLVWNGQPQSVVNFTVTDPSGEVVSFNKQSSPSGGMYIGSNSAPNGHGAQAVEWGLNPSLPMQFPVGTYTTSETLTTAGTASATLEIQQITFPNQIETVTAPLPIVDTLNSGKTVKHTVTIPIQPGPGVIVTGGGASPAARRK